MKKITLLFALAVTMVVSTQAQSSYKSAIGGRFGDPLVSFSYKQFVTKPGAIEVHAGFNHYGGFADYGFNSFTFGAQYQHHFPIGSIEGFKWYIGGGALATTYAYGDYYDNFGYKKIRPGVNAVGGVDYKFKKIPLNLSADVMPTIYFGEGYYDTFRPLGGVAVRYTLN